MDFNIFRASQFILMEEEFTRSLFNKIFYIALACVPALFFVIIYLKDPQPNPALSVFPIMLSLFAILVIASQVKNKLIISADHIVRISIWGRKELLTANVKGIRIAQKSIVIEPISSNYSRIVINNYNDYTNDEDLTNWLRENFADLDKADIKNETEQLLTDSSLGTTEKEREEKLSNAKKIAMVYNICGVVVGVWMLFTDTKISLIASLAFPALGVVVMATNKLIAFVSNSKRSIYPHILFGFIMNAMFIIGKAVREFDIYRYDNVLLPVLILALVVISLLVITGINRAIQITAQLATMILLGAIYAFGSILQVNCVFDTSIPVDKQTIVFNKYSDYNKGRHYHLKLKTFGDNPKTLNTEVSLARFDRYNEGDTIPIYLRKGELNIAWYTFYK